MNIMDNFWMSLMILLQAFHAYGIPGRHMLRAGNVVAGKRLIGHFKCDLGTVFAASGMCASLPLNLLLFNHLMGTLKQRSNGPLYSNTVILYTGR